MVGETFSSGRVVPIVVDGIVPNANSFGLKASVGNGIANLIDLADRGRVAAARKMAVDCDRANCQLAKHWLQALAV